MSGEKQGWRDEWVLNSSGVTEETIGWVMGDDYYVERSLGVHQGKDSGTNEAGVVGENLYFFALILLGKMSFSYIFFVFFTTNSTNITNGE